MNRNRAVSKANKKCGKREKSDGQTHVHGDDDACDKNTFFDL
jgi:hypothetical protein